MRGKMYHFTNTLRAIISLFTLQIKATEAQRQGLDSNLRPRASGAVT